ncbi:hypothetical protein ACPV5T_16375 [Vibrio astriarenae]
MSHCIQFEPHIHSQIDDLIRFIPKKDDKAYLTLLIDKHQVQLIGGVKESLNLITFEHNDAWGLKKGQWSLCATSFIQLWQLTNLEKHKAPFALKVEYNKDTPYPKVDNLTSETGRLFIEAQPPREAHLAFHEKTQQLVTQKVSTKAAQAIIEVADTYRPFDTFELDCKQQVVKVERQGVPTPYDLPESFEPEFDLLLNKQSLDNLKHLAFDTSAEHIDIYMDDDQAIFSDGQRILSSSLASLKDYAQKQEIEYETKARLIVNLVDFKKQIDDYRSNAKVKKGNQALIYIDNDCVMIGGLTDETGLHSYLDVADSKTDRTTVFRVNLSELSKIRLQDVITKKTKQMKVQFLKTTQGDYKLGFYNNINKTHPYAYVHDVEYAPQEIARMQKEKEKLDALINPEGQQIDAIGFDDV